MTAAVAPARTTGAHLETRDSVSADLATIGLTRDDIEVLRALSFHPIATVEEIQRVVQNDVSIALRSLVVRLLVGRRGSSPIFYSLTRVGWSLLIVANVLLFPATGG